MPNIWSPPEEITVPESLKAALGGHPLVAETLVRRGISDPDEARAFLDPAHYTPTPASELPGIPKATIRISRALAQAETILVWGDFDVDGQTSTTLLVEALRELGAQVKYHIPVRATEGHGIKVDVLAEIIRDNPEIRVLLTCDTGIAANEAVAFANANGLDVVITDHHDLPEELPPAHAIVDPRLLPNDHPLATLPGVGVAYKLVEALFEQQTSIEKHHPQLRGNAPSPEKYLDLVALGIVADVAEQRGDTRYLLQRGLNVLCNTQRLGLQTLMELAQIIPNQLNEGDIGFGIGPRLNALGRLSDADPIVEFLTTADASRARVLATQLEGLNERRKLLTEQIAQAALAQIEQDQTLIEKAALVLAHPGWHTGVIGIVASRLGERFGKPTILLSIGEDGIARGSARSITGVHITEAIATQKELLISFGGHPGAAGLALPEVDIPLFRRGLGQAVRAQLRDKTSEPALHIDAYLPFADISLALVDEIGQLAPFGAGNPSLTLASKNLRLVSHTAIGRRKDHLRLVVADETDQHQDVLWWNGVGNPLPEAENPFALAYTIQGSTYRGKRQLQIQWVDFHTIAEPAPKVDRTQPAMDIIDFRGQPHPLSTLQSIQRAEDIQIWAEGEAQSKLGGIDRYALAPGLPLAVWTTPPSPKEWQAALEKTRPEKIYLFAIDPGIDDPKTFLGRLSGLAKFSLRAHHGKVRLSKLAAATAQTEEIVRIGILWLEAKGFIAVARQGNGDLRLTAGDGHERETLPEITDTLKSTLAETAAFRAYFAKNTNGLT
jgi:single-stranded-DNA-specific exonuclease